MSELNYLINNNSVALHSMNESASNFISYGESYSLIYENILLALFLILLDFMTIMGNSFVIMAIIFDLNLRSPTHYLMGSLASADLMIGLCILPFSSFQMYFNYWPFGEAFCTVWKTVDVLCCTASIYLLLAISVDRYIGVTRPLSYSSILTKKRVYMVISAVWVLSLSVSLVGIGWKSPDDIHSNLCEVNKDILYSFFSASMSFYIPLVFICIIYYRIYKEARIQMIFIKTGTKESKADDKGNKVTLRVHRGPTKNSCTCQKENKLVSSNMTVEQKKDDSKVKVIMKGKSDSNSCPNCSANLFSSKLSRFKREEKAAKNLAIVVGCLVLCWMPFFIILPIETVIAGPNPLLDQLLTIFFWLGYCNSAMNPLIYAYSSREFRKAYKGLLKCNIRQINKRENLQKLGILNSQNTILANRTNQYIINKNNKKASLCKNLSEKNSLI